MQKKNSEKRISIFLILLISGLIYNVNFAIVISDNDGSAFITKSEFDSLKTNFQMQIDQYNTSIDNKIDSAIASYLSGIKVSPKTSQISLINNIDMPFKKNWIATQTRLGTYNMAYLHIGYGRAAWRIGYVNVAETKASNHDGNNGAWKAENPDNPDIFYVYSELNIGNNKYIYLDRGIESRPTGAISCVGWGWDTVAFYGTTYGFQDKTYLPTSDTFQNEVVTNTITFGGQTYTANGIGTWSSPDTNIDSSFITQLPGESINITNDQYVVKNTELNLVNKSRVVETRKCTVGYANCKYNGTDYISADSYGDWIRVPKLNIYGHKYTTKKWNDFINYDCSVALNKPVAYYNGLPLFKATNDGIVELKKKAINNLGDTTYIAINDDTFGNVSVGTGGIFPDAECTFTDWCMNSNVEYTIKFKVKKGKTYWVKACPSTNDSLSKITTTSIIIESEQK